MPSGIHYLAIVLFILSASVVAQRLKRLPPMRETWVRSLRWENPLEKEMVTPTPVFLHGESVDRGAW